MEHRDEEIEEASLEVLSEARRLANKARVSVAALVLGHSGQAFADPLGQYGADKLLVVEHELLAAYTTDGYTAALTAMLRGEHQPEALLMAASVLGRDLAPRLATRLKTSLVSDCTVLEINANGELELTRPSYGGKVYATMACHTRLPQIASIRPGVLGLGKPRKGRSAQIVSLSVDLEPQTIRTVSRGIRKVDREKLDIQEAEIILAFGRGAEDEATVARISELARLLEASLGGSRAAVDERWIAFDRQIGQTGKTVAPKVILCCGISGAQQFTMGMRDAKFIAAINNDRRAPIFKVADVSILCDLKEIIPELISHFQSLPQQPDRAAGK
ncbi:MAG: electron transfer flavoprotein subunit alpha/FixB family protein [Desulfobacterales bacterium]|nr:electron transfer flavoprotein subunit alpha/FixB family protein [Desulfobacterales bacterium]